MSIHQDNDKNVHLPLIQQSQHGITREIELSADFFNSSDYSQIVELVDKIDGLIEKDSYLTRGEQKKTIPSLEELLSWLLNEASKGLTISRYKGLGEMNPEQLWDTTMNPETRNLLQVKIEDAILTDEMFTTLMGDQVQPRREFIEKNALDATNIDT